MLGHSHGGEDLLPSSIGGGVSKGCHAYHLIDPTTAPLSFFWIHRLGTHDTYKQTNTN